MVKIKESVQQSTEDIIDQINATKTATDLFSDYPEVRKGATELLIAILDALDNIVIFYLSKSCKHEESRIGRTSTNLTWQNG